MKKTIIILFLLLFFISCSSKKDYTGFYDVLTKDNKKIGNMMIIDTSNEKTIRLNVYSTNIQSFIKEKEYWKYIYKKAKATIKPFDYNAFLSVKSNVLDEDAGCHWVFWDAKRKKVRDSSWLVKSTLSPLRNYKILDIVPLVYVEENN